MAFAVNRLGYFFFGYVMKIVLRLLFLAFFGCGQVLANPVIVPKPNHLVWQNDQFTLNKNTTLVYLDDASQASAEALNFWLNKTSGFPATAATRKNDMQSGIVLQIDSTNFSQDESYRIEVSRQQARLIGASKAGLFYAVETFKQLFDHSFFANAPVNQSQWVIPTVQISDQPRFAYRGMHLDVSRHFFDIEFIKNYIDWLAAHKFNVFQWHLTDDQGWRIEVKKYPKLTSVGARRSQTVVGHTYDYQPLFDAKTVSGFYSQAQIKEVIEYAKARHIEVIPEIDIPGHSTALLAAYPEFGCKNQTLAVEDNFGIFEPVLCPTEQTFAFLKNVYSEVAALFPSQYIHIGGDEVIKTQWLESAFVKQLMTEQGLSSGEQVQSYFIKRVSQIIKQLDKKMIGWDEILEGGLAQDALVTSWRGEEGGIKAAKLGHNVIMSPYQHIYFDAYQSESSEEPKAIHGLTRLKQVYHYEPIPKQLTKGQQSLVLGAQGALWTEYIKTPRHAEYMLFPRLAALSEVLWSKQKDWQAFNSALPQLISRYRQQGINVSTSHYNPHIDVSFNATPRITLNADGYDGALRYTLDNKFIDFNSAEYKKSLSVFATNKIYTVSAKQQLNSLGEFSKRSHLTFAQHKALNKKISFVDAPAKGGAKTILDGRFAYDQFYDVNKFAVFYGNNMDATIDFIEPTAFSKIVMGVDTGRHRQLHPPFSVSVSVSNNTSDWQEVITLSQEQTTGPLLTLSFEPQKAKYLRVTVINADNSQDPQIPKLPLYIDEIAVF